jgi:hypothetical protein
MLPNECPPTNELVNICGEPKGEVRIKQFTKLNYHTIQSVRMLGSGDGIKFSQENEGLVVQMPEVLPSRNAVCLKIVPKLAR